MDIAEYSNCRIIDNTDIKRQQPCSLMINHFNCPHIIIIPNHRINIIVNLLHPTCVFINNTFSNDKYYTIVESFQYCFIKQHIFPKNLYENLLEMWEDFDTLNRRCIIERRLSSDTYLLCRDIYISAIDIDIEKNWKRQYCIASCSNRNIISGNIDEIIAFIEVNYPECINPLQFIKLARI